MVIINDSSQSVYQSITQTISNSQVLFRYDSSIPGFAKKATLISSLFSSLSAVFFNNPLSWGLKRLPVERRSGRISMERKISGTKEVQALSSANKPNNMLRFQRLLRGWSLQRVADELCAIY